ncbi:MAG: hypothetical protein ILO42_00695 [Clostridia bacterium]|nr:hypothetical protein [Clostridia bacterium]
MTEEYKDEYVKVCPYCGGNEMIEAYQSAYGALTAKSNPFGGCALYHAVCRRCGSVVRSFVKEPEKLLRRKDRR